MASVNQVAPDDWDRHWKNLEGSSQVNPAQEYRRQLLLSNLKFDSANHARVLDIGSGLGDFLGVLDELYPRMRKLGLEFSESGVEISRRRLPQLSFLQRDLISESDTPAEYQNFATHAVCSEVLEHVDDPVMLLKNARPYMADGCQLVVTVPGGPRSQFDLHIGHREHFSPARLRQVLTDAGFKVEYATGAGFPFFNLYRLLVILRGGRLIVEASEKPGLLLRVTSTLFRILFRFNISRSFLGWQTLAVAYK
ncbi:class I SAM-dependent methyltransferase [Bradyrhizobium sp.]